MSSPGNRGRSRRPYPAARRSSRHRGIHGRGARTGRGLTSRNIPVAIRAARIGLIAAVIGLIGAMIGPVGSVITDFLRSDGSPKAKQPVPVLPLDSPPGMRPAPTCEGCASGTTYSEQASPTGSGARTFANPYTYGGASDRVAPGQYVDVVCKLYAFSSPSVDPGYWYLLASPPWNGRYYSPANSYINGGHGRDTDFRVPDCCPPDRPC